MFPPEQAFGAHTRAAWAALPSVFWVAAPVLQVMCRETVAPAKASNWQRETQNSGQSPGPGPRVALGKQTTRPWEPLFPPQNGGWIENRKPLTLVASVPTSDSRLL